MIENLKAFLREMERVEECVELAQTIQNSSRLINFSPKELEEVLQIMRRRVSHIRLQLLKGIAIEEELESHVKSFNNVDFMNYSTN
ncbi:MAG: hypothetical protein ISS17_03680 [Bacteroidales bacterium]|nr:hypothetical protein [Bacteroidales bacterium]